jgi:hypothetical protein
MHQADLKPVQFAFILLTRLRLCLHPNGQKRRQKQKYPSKKHPSILPVPS